MGREKDLLLMIQSIKERIEELHTEIVSKEYFKQHVDDQTLFSKCKEIKDLIKQIECVP